jgi:hypothetical protein
MSPHTIRKYQLYPFWDDAYKKLNYIHKLFNAPYNIGLWADSAQICQQHVWHTEDKYPHNNKTLKRS